MASRVALGVITLLLFASWLWRWQLVEDQMPYPGHMDERRLNRHALDVARSGSLELGWFEYPSLPIYLCSAGMRLGVALSGLSGEPTRIEDVEAWASLYSHPPGCGTRLCS